MNDERLAELQEKYKDRNLLEELAWGVYANHSGYTSKQDGEFLNWLCLMAYKALKERPQGEWGKWIITEVQCPNCFQYFETDCCSIEELNKCANCEADMKGEE